MRNSVVTLLWAFTAHQHNVRTQAVVYVTKKLSTRTGINWETLNFYALLALQLYVSISMNFIHVCMSIVLFRPHEAMAYRLNTVSYNTAGLACVCTS